jgi:hypothetical protein
MIIQKAILLGALQKICVSASFKLNIEGDISRIELVFKVNNTRYTSRMPISAAVALEIKTDWERIMFANFFEPKLVSQPG